MSEKRSFKKKKQVKDVFAKPKSPIYLIFQLFSQFLFMPTNFKAILQD
jgi:hypothetical protein